MAFEQLQYGLITALTQNQVYALPSGRALLFTDGAAPTLQMSTTSAFTANVAVTLTGGQCELAGGFLRCTNLATCNIVLKE